MWAFTIYILFFSIILLVLPPENENDNTKVDKVYGRIEQIYSKDDDRFDKEDKEDKKDKSLNV
jgi:hypothetical protein